MKFKSDYEFLFVEGIQFRDGKYETKNEDEIEILKKYPDRVEEVTKKNI